MGSLTPLDVALLAPLGHGALPEWLPAAPLVLTVALLLDVLLDDPPHWFHPVRAMGACITWWERAARDVSCAPGWLRVCGVLLALSLPLGCWLLVKMLLAVLTMLSPWLALGAAVYLTYTCLSLAGLAGAVAVVRERLHRGDLAGARIAVGHIVGRDTGALDSGGVAAAAVESAAENASDGFIAPLCFLALGGPALGLAYKAINTADSMIGHRDERFCDFGFGAARLDDLCNWIPARLTCLLFGAAALLRGCHPLRALSTAWRDAPRHASPNAGWPEAAVAGALGIQLGGDALYDGQIHHRPVLGEGGGPGVVHVAMALHLLWLTGALGAAIALLAVAGRSW
ncbi:MAG: adenosylcobinamide-phosphate synthase CbiB [Nitrospirota bacterium]|nr:adenosylcobinamide-phosphate synthase CbiB [Nitrospirota bacterium]